MHTIYISNEEYTPEVLTLLKKWSTSGANVASLSCQISVTFSKILEGQNLAHVHAQAHVHTHTHAHVRVLPRQENTQAPCLRNQY